MRSNTTTCLLPVCVAYPSKVAQQVEHKQDNEYKTYPATAPDMASVSVPAATEEKNKDNNKEDQHHDNILWEVYLFFAAGDGRVASFSVDADEGVVTVSVGFGGEWVGSKPALRAWM